MSWCVQLLPFIPNPLTSIVISHYSPLLFSSQILTTLTSYSPPSLHLIPSHATLFISTVSQAHSTIGGYVCAQAGEIPSSGETIVFSGYRFTVVSTSICLTVCVCDAMSTCVPRAHLSSCLIGIYSFAFFLNSFFCPFISFLLICSHLHSPPLLFLCQ